MFAVLIAAVLLLAGFRVTGLASDPIANDEPGLIALWHMNEGSGSTTADSSGKGHTGAINGATWVDGKFNKALSFNVSNNYVGINNPLGLNITTAGTVEAWIKPDATWGDYAAFIWKGIDPYVNYIIQRYESTNELEFYDGTNILHGGTLTAGSWNHVVVTISGTTCKGYINGVQVFSSTCSVGPHAGESVRIGSDDTGSIFKGIIDEAAIYNRTLSASEVLTQYNNGMGGVSASTTASPTSGTAPLTVSFTCSASGGTSPYTYVWTFGDGGTSTSQNPSHTYSSGGTYTATCTVTDSTSATGSSSKTITVTGADTTAPTVSVSHSPSSPTTADPVTLTATVSDNVGVTAINITVDGSLKKTCASSPCSTTAQTYSLGTHTYYATASDAAGNVGRDPSSGTKSFPVTNVTTPPSNCTNLTWLHVDGKYIKNECGQKLFLRGAAFPDLSWRTTFQGGVETRFYQYVKLTNGRANVIRVPMYPGPPEDFDLAVDEIVNLAARNNTYIVLENHGGVDLTQNTTYFMNWYLHWVNKYKNNPTVVGIELWNEPYVDDTRFINFMTQATQTITAANPKLLIFVSSNSFWMVDPYWIQNPLPGNVVYTWDYYYMNWQPEVKQFYYNQQWSAAYDETYGWIDYVIGDALRANLPVLASEFGWYNDYAPPYPQYRSEPEWQRNMNDYMSIINGMETNWYIWMWWGNPDHTGLAIDDYSALTPYGQIWAQYLVGTRPSDTLAPSVSVSHSPSSPNSTTSVTVTATASDNVGVTAINIYVDSSLKKACASSPCSTTAQTYSLGNHTYYANASDAAGNKGRDPSSGTKVFTVTNVPQPPVCGNNVKETGEECDGTDASACPGQCLGNCSCPVAPPPCTESWTCGSWSSCVGGAQTRTCTDSNACGTTNLKPPESQSCQECVESWLCTQWSSCVGGAQTRTCTDSNACGTTKLKPQESQSCCTEDWLCGSWSSCVGGAQTRTCTDSNACGTTVLKPNVSQTCCMEDWTCGSWSSCVNNVQTRTCTDNNVCGTTDLKPNESQTCTTPPLPGPSCTEDWSCGAWSSCVNSAQTRTCTDNNACGTTDLKPQESQACTVPPPPPPPSGGGGGGGSSFVGPSGVMGGTTSGGGVGTAGSSSANKAQEITFQFNNVPFYEVAFTTLAKLSYPKVSVEDLGNIWPIEKASLMPDGLIYRYLDLTPTNIEEKNTQDIRIRFKVPLSFYTQYNIDPRKTKLQRWSGVKWDVVNSSQTGSDSSYYYFKATPRSLSLFAITAELTGIPPPSKTCNKFCEEGEVLDIDSCSCITVGASKVQASIFGELDLTNLPLVAGVMVVIIVILVLFVPRRRKPQEIA